MRHLRGTVRLVDGLHFLKSLAEAVVLVEAGPGNTLSRSARASGFTEAQVVAIDPDPAGNGQAAFLAALGRLWTLGADVDRRAAAGPSIRRRAAPPYPYERVRLWIDRAKPAFIEVPAAARPITSKPAVTNAAALDVMLAEWRDVLGTPNLGAEDDFFELGGDSLLAVRLVARLRHRFGRDVSTADLFGVRTPAGLARILNSKSETSGTPANGREAGWL
jgi:acyl transferase domain-containing protein